MDRLPPGADGLAAGSRRRSVLVWVAWLIAIAPTAVGLYLMARTPGLALPAGTWGFRGFEAPLAVTFSTVGFFILARRPSNLVARLYAIAGTLAGVMFAAGEYSYSGALANPGSLPAANWAAWVASWLWTWGAVCGPLLFLVTPNGRLIAPSWRSVVWLAVGSSGLVTFAIAFRTGPLTSYTYAINPVGGVDPAVSSVLLVAGALGLAVATVLAMASLVLRYRRAGEVERLQLKWVALAAVIVAIAAPVGMLTDSTIAQALYIFGLCGVGIATGAAVLRYRLYEIDTIINRALVYGLLTAILAGISAASISLLQRALQTATGERSDSAIILTTLIVVAAFNPIKARLQAGVDHHFKEAPDPVVRLAAFRNMLGARISPLDAELVFARLLDVAVTSCRASGGLVERATSEGGTSLVATCGSLDGGAAVRLTSGGSDGAGGIVLKLGPREADRPYLAQEQSALQLALDTAVHEIGR